MTVQVRDVPTPKPLEKPLIVKNQTCFPPSEKGPGIDVNRGVSIFLCKDSDVKVFVYKDTPGVWYDRYGVEISVERLRSLDYPKHLIDEGLKVRQRRELEARSRETVDALIASRSNSEAAKVIAERSNVRLRDIGLGRFTVTLVEGDLEQPVTSEHLSQDVAFRVFEKLAGAA